MTANVPVKFLFIFEVSTEVNKDMVSGDYSAKEDRQLSLNTYCRKLH